MMRKLTKCIRRLYGIQEPISCDQALRIAQQECDEKKWGWIEPISIEEHILTYEIKTNATQTGGNVFMTISVRNGEILSAALGRR
jgi:hypothetical protein